MTSPIFWSMPSLEATIPQYLSSATSQVNDNTLSKRKNDKKLTQAAAENISTIIGQWKK